MPELQTDPQTPNPPAPVAHSTPVFTKEQVDDAVANARKQEKDKLYPDLQKAKEDLRRNEDRIRALETDLADARKGGDKVTQLEGQIETLRKDREALDKKVTDLDAHWTKVVDDALMKQAKEMETKDLARFRQTLIDAADGAIIPEIVAGNTEEEIKASVEKAKARYVEIAGKGGEVKEKELREKYKGALPAPAESGNNAGATNQSTTGAGLGDWRKLPPAEREQKLQEMKKQAFEQAGLQR